MIGIIPVPPQPPIFRPFRELVATHPATWMIWESDPLPSIAAKLTTVGVRSVVLSPCGNRPGHGDFISVMKQNVVALKDVLGPGHHQEPG